MVALMHRKSEQSHVISLLPLLCCCHTEGPLKQKPCSVCLCDLWDLHLPTGRLENSARTTCLHGPFHWECLLAAQSAERFRITTMFRSLRYMCESQVTSPFSQVSQQEVCSTCLCEYNHKTSFRSHNMYYPTAFWLGHQQC